MPAKLNPMLARRGFAVAPVREREPDDSDDSDPDTKHSGSSGSDSSSEANSGASHSDSGSDSDVDVLNRFDHGPAKLAAAQLKPKLSRPANADKANAKAKAKLIRAKSAASVPAAAGQGAGAAAATAAAGSSPPTPTPAPRPTAPAAAKPMTLTLTVPKSLHNTRLDAAVGALLLDELAPRATPHTLSSQLVGLFVARGCVRLNGRVTDAAATKVRARDVLTILLSASDVERATTVPVPVPAAPRLPIAAAAAASASAAATGAAAAPGSGVVPVGSDGKLVLQPDPIALARVRVVYADAHVIVVDKPAGMVVHPAPDSRAHVDRGTLVHALLAFVDAERRTAAAAAAAAAAASGRAPATTATGLSAPPDDPQGMRPGIVHRIDRDTTGLLVVARTNAAHAHLKAQFAAHTCYRRYNCFVTGAVKADCGTLDTTLGRHPTDRKRRAVLSVHAITAGPGAMGAHAQPPDVTAVPAATATTGLGSGAAAAADGNDDDDGPGGAAAASGAAATGKRAVTHYFVCDRFVESKANSANNTNNSGSNSGGGAKTAASFSLVECALETGRTHQVRVHMRHLTHPILCDADYATKPPKPKTLKPTSLWKRVLDALTGPGAADANSEAEAGAEGQLLHARRLGFVHPHTHQWMVFESALPPCYQRLLTVLQPHALPRTSFQQQRAVADAAWLAAALRHTTAAAAAAMAAAPASAAASSGTTAATAEPADSKSAAALTGTGSPAPAALLATVGVFGASASVQQQQQQHKPSQSTYELESGRVLHIAELPTSTEVGHKLWRATPLLGKYLERLKPSIATAVAHRLPPTAAAGSSGDSKSAPAKPRARWLELGAGCGLLSLILADTGCRVVGTDIGTGDVLKLMHSNFVRNSGDALASGSLVCRELTWQQTDVTPLLQLHGAVDPVSHQPLTLPFDGIAAVDVTYHERLLRPLLLTIRQCSSSKTQIFVAGEQRCPYTHAKFLALAGDLGFAVTVVPPRKLHKALPAAYHDDDVFVLQLKLLPGTATASAATAAAPAAAQSAAAAK